MPAPSLFALARLAFERGYIDLTQLMSLIHAAGRADQDAPPLSFWIGPGRLTTAQLGHLLEADAPTAPVSSPSSLPASSDDLFSIALSGVLNAPAEAPLGPPSPSVPKGRPIVAPSDAGRPVLSSTPPPAPPARGPRATQPPPAPAPRGPAATQPPPPRGPVPTQPPPARPGASTRPPSSSHETTHERFKVVGELGVGGMGRVIEVEDQRLGRRVAVKSLRADLPDKELPAQLLEREARITGGLEHPHIVPVYDSGNDAALGPYYVMRVLKQPTLLHVLSRLRQNQDQADYPLGKLLRLFVQVCHAIDYANARGVVHCDLKPANILLGGFGEVLVVDWGFAQRIGEPSPVHGGTPGYMAPEQLDPTPGKLDGRADVFALGTVLYEILSLKKAFPSPSVEAMIGAVMRGEPPLVLPPPPSAVAPDRPIATELDDICMRTLALDPAARYPTARALAEALEAFLEGTRERERRLERAIAHTQQGDDLAASYDEMVASGPERAAALAELRQSIEPWSEASAKQPLWDAEDSQAVLDALSVRTFQAAVMAYEQALDETPGHAPARAGLARLYLGEAERARQRRDAFNRLYFEGLVHQFDDGTLAGQLEKGGVLEVTTTPPARLATLQPLAEHGRRLVAATSRPAAPTPLRLDTLAPGPYLIECDDLNGRPVWQPALVRVGSTYHAHLDLALASQRQPDEELIPGGVALLGGHPSSRIGHAPVEVDVPSFFLATRPVSFADYLAFVAELFATDPDAAAHALPTAADGAFYWQWDGSDFVPAQVSAWGDNLLTLLALPAVGVDLEGALAYARWVAARTGLPYRLPTEHEWEKAARGVDGRAYPWGDSFDPSFCKMRLSRPGPARPEPSGFFPGDVSVYGVRDLAGGVAEWTQPTDPSDRYAVARGGAWCDWAGDCHAAARRLYERSERSERVGFRLAR